RIRSVVGHDNHDCVLRHHVDQVRSDEVGALDLLNIRLKSPLEDVWSDGRMLVQDTTAGVLMQPRVAALVHEKGRMGDRHMQEHKVWGARSKTLREFSPLAYLDDPLRRHRGTQIAEFSVDKWPEGRTGQQFIGGASEEWVWQADVRLR